MVGLDWIGALATLLNSAVVRVFKTPQDRALSDRQKAEAAAKEYKSNVIELLKKDQNDGK